MMLSGVRVVEIGQALAAPFATEILADLGADVIVEKPDGGDDARHWGAATATVGRWRCPARLEPAPTVTLATVEAREFRLIVNRARGRFRAKSVKIARAFVATTVGELPITGR